MHNNNRTHFYATILIIVTRMCVSRNSVTSRWRVSHIIIMPPMTKGSMRRIVVFEILSKMCFSFIFRIIFQNIHVDLCSSMTLSCIL